jgi:hypothetical protein
MGTPAGMGVLMLLELSMLFLAGSTKVGQDCQRNPATSASKLNSNEINWLLLIVTLILT